MSRRTGVHLFALAATLATAAVAGALGSSGAGEDAPPPVVAPQPGPPTPGPQPAPPVTVPDKQPDPPAAADEKKPDELPVSDGTTPIEASKYRDLPKPFHSKQVGEDKPMYVWYDAKARRVFIEGKFCLVEGGLEFLAVAVGGKTHESLLTLDCRPQDILYAVLVCTYEPNNNLQGEGEKIVPAGDPLNIYVEFKNKDGKLVRRRIEDFAYNKYTKTHMRNISYAFTGSSYTKDPDTGKSVFVADMEKDVVTCFRTAWSVFNTPLIQGDNDTVYEVYKDILPEKNTPCVMIITAGKTIKANEIDDSGGVKIKEHSQDGKAAQMQNAGPAPVVGGFEPGLPTGAP